MVDSYSTIDNKNDRAVLKHCIIGILHKLEICVVI